MVNCLDASQARIIDESTKGAVDLERERQNGLISKAEYILSLSSVAMLSSTNAFVARPRSSESAM